MLGRITGMCGTVLIAFVTSSFAGILTVEVPADVGREDILNPTDEMTTRLKALMHEAVRENPAAAEFGPVAFTKNGELILPDVEPTETDDWSENRLTFEPAETPENMFLWPEYEGSWDAAYWHLREVGQPDYNGVYELAEDIFGYPFWPREITVEWDETLQVEGYYNCSLGTIYIQNWRNWENYLTQDPGNWPFHDDAAVLTRCMLQAWHQHWQAYWDHFGSMRRAAWIAIHNRLADDGYELGFNDLYHDDQRDDRFYYKCLDNYNTEEFGTRLHNWADEENSRIDGRIKYWRYGAANYCWWKVYEKQPGFFYAFNREFYEWLENVEFAGLPLLYANYRTFADTADNGTLIEGRSFPEWFDAQPILQHDHWCDDICALAVDRTTARVLAYRRYVDALTGYDCEVGHSSPNARVLVEKRNWQGGLEDYYVVDPNNGGYGEWDSGVDDADAAMRFTAEYTLAGTLTVSGTCWGIDSNTAYDNDVLYGVVTDAIDGAGTVTIKEGGLDLVTVPVYRKAFRWAPLSAPGPGEYEIVYTPPAKNGGLSGEPWTIVKDGASYFDARSYVSESAIVDDNGNGIPDGSEQVLAEKFVPQIQMHNGNELVPTKVGMMVDPGRGPLVKYKYDNAGRVYIDSLYFPTEEYTMEQIFEETRPQWYESMTAWKLVFGPNYGMITPPYWHDNYAQILSNPEYEGRGYDEPTVYYNIFKYVGKPVIQYWFYYPFNDWRNDHEGDWEHINVRITSSLVDLAEIDEVIYYLHKKYAVKPGAVVPVVNDTHPLVFVGGEWPGGPDTGRCSGASYWQLGYFINAGEYGTDEVVSDGGTFINWQWFVETGHSDERLVRNDRGSNLWWSEFPFGWGRTKGSINNGFGGWTVQSSPNSPVNHECFESYITTGYEEYGGDTDNPLAAVPPAGGDTSPVPRETASPVPSPDLAFRPSPGAGDYRAPDAASTPGGNELGEPGADLPPMGDPALTSPGGFGGDEIEAGSAASPYSAGGVPAGTAARPPVACYPNPVTGPTATVSFAVKEAGKVRLAVYDISGRRVATLAEGHYPAGEYSAEWNADVPTGVYVYRLEAAGTVAAGKVVVAR